jgi:predicted ATP-grasp superfamily ATP-dependent carboligase
MQMPPVLVLDANQRSALAATRALGSRGIPVFAGDETRRTLAGSSRYCAGSWVYPSPSTAPAEFIAAVRQAAVDRGAAVVFPMTDATSYLLVRHRASFPDIHIPSGSLEAFETLADKWRLWCLARTLDIPAPATIVVAGLEELPALYPTLRFPMVVKPRRSRAWSDGKCIAAPVGYAHSVEELQALIAREPAFRQQGFLLQEYVHGEGQGLFALYAHGKPVVFFAHRRLREKPPSGGVSVLSESIPLDPRMREFARRILDHVCWHGVAMLEFKVSPAGEPYLIEVNPRFWGSLQLALDAGVDFPYLLYRIAIGAAPDAASGYSLGVKSRWLLGDVDHLYLTLKGHPGPGFRPTSKWQSVTTFFNLFDRATRYDVNRRDDPQPFLYELGRYFEMKT